MTSAADKLRKARALIEDPARWTTGVLARSAKGNDVSPHGRAAVRWCGVGAALRVGLGFLDLDGQAILGARVIRLLEPDGTPLNEVNDEIGHASVLMAYDRAIELAEAEA